MWQRILLFSNSRVLELLNAKVFIDNPNDIESSSANRLGHERMRTRIEADLKPAIIKYSPDS